MLNIHKFQGGYELFTTLCIVGDSDLAGIYEYLTSNRGSYCKNESIIIVISGKIVLIKKACTELSVPFIDLMPITVRRTGYVIHRRGNRYVNYMYTAQKT